MDGVVRGSAEASRAFARRRWALLPVVALVLAALTAAAPVATAPLVRRIISASFQGSATIITIAAGSNDGVQKNWRVCLLRDDGDEPLPGGEVEVIRVDKAVTIGKIHLTSDALKGHRRVLLSP
jgi:hypothetical protein